MRQVERGRQDPDLDPREFDVRPALRCFAALALLLPALPARAELVLLTNHHVVKVVGYQVLGDQVRLDLRTGGRMTVQLELVERIVDDEVVPQPEPLPVVEPAPYPLAFLDSQPVPATPYGHLIYDAARRHALNPELVAAVVRAESAFDVGAVSHKGARGLMQLMPATAQRFGVAAENLFDPGSNLEAGTRYLKWLAERYGGDLPRILAAYNAGEATVERYGGVPPYRETRDYIRRVFSVLGLALGEVAASR